MNNWNDDWEMNTSWDTNDQWEEAEEKEAKVFKIVTIEDIKAIRSEKILSLSSQYNMVIEDIDLIVKVIGIDNPTTWNKFIDNMDDFRKKYNILEPIKWIQSDLMSDNKECPLCLQSFNFKDGYESVCGHWHCKECCKAYLTSEIHSETGGIFVGCMAMISKNNTYEKCNIRIPFSHVKQIVTPKVFSTYEKNTIQHFIQYNSTITSCPGLNCDKYVEYTEGGHQDIICECKTNFCFRCKLTPHFMVPCDLAGLSILFLYYLTI